MGNKKTDVSEAGVLKPGTAVSNRTGSWRTFRPKVTAKCTGCGICEWYCPDRAIKVVEKGGKKTAVVDFEHCKGCLICVEVCPVKAVEKEIEHHE